MKRFLHGIAAAICAAALLSSCGGTDPERPEARRVLLMYAAAFSNLSNSISEDIDEICESGVPAAGSSDVLLIYAHTTRDRTQTKDLNAPVMFRVYRDTGGNVVRDTLFRYPETDDSATTEVFKKVLGDAVNHFPAKHYGMIFSSHGRGWVPPGYSESTSIWSVGPEGEQKEYPLTKEMGIEYGGKSGMDIREVAGAMPVKFDFIIMDACLMGCVEVAWELRDKCRLLAFSPTEILTNGFYYKDMAPLLLNTPTPDVERVCREYFEQYDRMSGLYRSATVTLIDCSKMDALARACADIFSAHRDALDGFDPMSVQPYFYNNLHWFYDLRDLAVKLGASAHELQVLDDALGACIVYYACTEKFFDLELKDVCGLSTYIPLYGKNKLNNYYKTLSWNAATGLIQ